MRVDRQHQAPLSLCSALWIIKPNILAVAGLRTVMDTRRRAGLDKMQTSTHIYKLSNQESFLKAKLLTTSLPQP
jgi:hypothetical protein